MKDIYYYCVGESHKATEKPCQDCAWAESSDSLSMAIVCDGHGGERYFRSQLGSKYAVDITKSAVRAFVESMAESSFNNEGRASVFSGEPFTSYIEVNASESQIASKAHKALTWLFSSIISQWNIAIAKDARKRNLSEWEKEHVEQKYIDEFLASREKEDATFEKTYGCTLMAYVQTPEYWFAFHIGDGKCVFMNVNNGQLECSQPIPWDDACFLNKTTSLCDSQALSEFRYCYQGDGHFPLAVFLGSDGMDDSYGDGENLNNFYIKLYKQIIKSGEMEAYNVLKRDLPQISAKGSRDDMSVASIYSETGFKELFKILTAYQIRLCQEQISASIERANQMQEKINAFGDPSNLDKGQKINLDYAVKDRDKAQAAIQKATKRMKELHEEQERFERGSQKMKPKSKLSIKEQKTLSGIKKKK